MPSTPSNGPTSRSSASRRKTPRNGKVSPTRRRNSRPIRGRATRPWRAFHRPLVLWDSARPRQKGGHVVSGFRLRFGLRGGAASPPSPRGGGGVGSGAQGRGGRGSGGGGASAI